MPEVSEKSGGNRKEERISPGLHSQRIAVVGVESGPEMVSGGSSGEDEGPEDVLLTAGKDLALRTRRDELDAVKRLGLGASNVCMSLTLKLL